MSKNSKISTQRKQEFLQTFFDDGKFGDTREVNGFLLVKQPGQFGNDVIFIYTKESFNKSQEFYQEHLIKDDPK